MSCSVDMPTCLHILNRLHKKRFGFRYLERLGVGYYDFRKLISDGVIERVSRGIYQRTDNHSDEDSFITASVVIGKPSAICLLSALEHYNLTDHIVKKTWLMVPIAKRTSIANIRLFRKKSPRWNVGIENKKLYSITNIERTLVESMVYRRRLGSDVAIFALKKAIKSNKTTLNKVWNMAGELGYKNRIKSIIEVLSFND